jgi:hypothetical protein
MMDPNILAELNVLSNWHPMAPLDSLFGVGASQVRRRRNAGEG